MRFIIVLISLVSLVSLSAAELPSNVDLPQDALAAIKKWNPQFEPFTKTDYSAKIQKMYPDRTPSIVREDFSGDGVADVVVFGSSGKDKQAIVAAIADKKDPKKWTTIVVDETDAKDIKNTEIADEKKNEKGVPLYLTIGKGKLADDYKRIHKKPLIQFEAYMGFVELFAIEHGRALRVHPRP